MKKLMNWVLAATMICGASMFTSCTEGSDNPAPENAKNRKEFIKHTRENLKELAENLNFASWEIANRINQEFNTAVLNNPEFEKAIVHHRPDGLQLPVYDEGGWLWLRRRGG